MKELIMQYGVALSTLIILTVAALIVAHKSKKDEIIK
jgi:hypothetical protein